MTQLRKLLVLSLLVVVAFAVGCAPPVGAEKKGSSRSYVDKAPAESLFDTNTLYLNTAEPFVHVLNGKVKVCEEEANNAADYGPELISTIKSLHAGQVYVVLSRDGSYEAHTADKPERQFEGYCGKNGGYAYVFRYYEEPDAGFISNFSLTSSFSQLTKGGENAPCQGSGSVSLTFTPDMQVFKISGGKLQKPSFNVSVEADAAAGGSVKCSKALSSGPKIAMVGFVPVLYEVELTFAVSLEIAQAAHISATVGTSGGKMSISARDTTVTLTPSVELGVKFYKVIGASVGIDFPVTASFPPGKVCTPDLSLTAKLHAGISAPLGVSKALGLDFSTDIVGPISIASAQCFGGDEPVAAPAPTPDPTPEPAPTCACLGGRGVGGVDLGAFPCGKDVCGQDMTVWSCSADGVWSNPGQACQ